MIRLLKWWQGKISGSVAYGELAELALGCIALLICWAILGR